MTIVFKCSDCGKQYSIKDEMAGRRFSCKACGSAQQVPPLNKENNPAAASESYDDFEDVAPDAHHAAESYDDHGDEYAAGADAYESYGDYDDDYAPAPAHSRGRPVAGRQQHYASGETDVPGIISLIFGVLALVLLVFGCLFGSSRKLGL